MKYVLSIFLLIFTFGCSSLTKDNANKNMEYKGNDEYLIFILNDTPIYEDVHKENIIGNLSKGDIVETFDYYKKFNMLYLENTEIKGWIENQNISALRKFLSKLIILEDNTTSYDSINDVIKNTYKSGTVIDAIAYNEAEGSYLLTDLSSIEVDKVINMNCIKNYRIGPAYSGAFYLSITLLEILLLLSI